jgi:hypothetical protein
VNYLNRTFQFTLFFIVGLLLLKLTGVITVSFILILSLGNILFGFWIFIYLFGTHRSLMLFLSAFLFLMGMIFFIQESMQIGLPPRQYLLVVLLLPGFCFLLLYYENKARTVFLGAGLALVALGAGLLFLVGKPSFINIGLWLYQILKSIWGLLLALLLLGFYFLEREV